MSTFSVAQAQNDLWMVLRSAAALSPVNVAWYRKMVIARELDYRAMMMTPRPPGNKVGAAVLVLQPTAAAQQTNVTGPIFDWTFPVSSFELPSVNFGPQGTQQEAEDWAQIVASVLHLHADELYGTFRISINIQPEPQFVFPGCVGYRTNFHITGKNTQLPRVGQVAIAIAGGVCTLTCLTPGATIRYTLDGTFPALNAVDNAAAQTYSAPFAVTSGQAVRACAFMAGLNNSAARYSVAP